jgi:hypothetical protein
MTANSENDRAEIVDQERLLAANWRQLRRTSTGVRAVAAGGAWFGGAAPGGLGRPTVELRVAGALGAGHGMFREGGGDSILPGFLGNAFCSNARQAFDLARPRRLGLRGV